MLMNPKLVCCALPAAALCAALCLADEAGSLPPSAEDARLWQPPAIEQGAYDDITMYNIFQPNRAGLVAEAEREPEVPDDPRPIEPVIELPPPDPDASLLLVGISVRGERPTAFIEDRATGEITELDRPGEFSQGEITAISHNKIIYIIDDETREVRVGFALTGERAVAAPPARPAPNSGPSDEASSDTPSEAGGESAPADGLSDLERRMRERRNSE